MFLVFPTIGGVVGALLWKFISGTDGTDGTVAATEVDAEPDASPVVVD